MASPGRGVDGLVYTNSQPYSKRACAFGLRSLSKLLTLSALVKPEKSLFFLERIGTKIVRQAHYEGHKMHKRDKKTAKKHLFLAALFPIEMRTISRIIFLKCAEFGAVMLRRKS